MSWWAGIRCGERPAALLMRALAAGGEQGLPEPVVEAVSAR
ncbi:hypothetical protein HD597_002853 [Nonomuraea thailandensis]|uniref:Uncharacterized protein n=1 Tax=Nonomuraea thailandensis TaxID=1188745 RepID=A0A9X2GJR8_9ACTN|nr:hypothetical protein [Nonomuraea thailandensis]MCP2355833.1 hypothetical protein [Nonomuraea thailandensis]